MRGDWHAAYLATHRAAEEAASRRRPRGRWREQLRLDGCHFDALDALSLFCSEACWGHAGGPRHTREGQARIAVGVFRDELQEKLSADTQDHETEEFRSRHVNGARRPQGGPLAGARPEVPNGSQHIANRSAGDVWLSSQTRSRRRRRSFTEYSNEVTQYDAVVEHLIAAVHEATKQMRGGRAKDLKQGQPTEGGQAHDDCAKDAAHCLDQDAWRRREDGVIATLSTPRSAFWLPTCSSSSATAERLPS